MTTTKPRGRQLVRATYKMDSETFALHMNHRHSDSLAGMRLVNPQFEQEEAYRSFHRRLHATRADLDHEHGPDSLADNVRRAIEQLQEKALRGWFEISGVPGEFVSVFPDGQITTRVQGFVRHHNSVEEAVGHLVASVRNG